MRRITAFLSSIWHYELCKFDWIIVGDINGKRRACYGEDVEIIAFKNKKELEDYIKYYIPKAEQEKINIFRRINLRKETR